MSHSWYVAESGIQPGYSEPWSPCVDGYTMCPSSNDIDGGQKGRDLVDFNDCPWPTDRIFQIC